MIKLVDTFDIGAEREGEKGSKKIERDRLFIMLLAIIKLNN